MFEWLRRNRPTKTGGAPEGDGSEVPAWIVRGDAARDRGDASVARQAYARAHSLAPTKVYPLYWLAYLDQAAGNLPSALSFARLALAQDPDQIGLLLLTASIEAASGNDAGALRCYERAYKLDPEIPDLEALRADALCRLSRIPDGVTAFDAAIRRKPESMVLRQNRLFVLNYDTVLEPAALALEHRAVAALIAAASTPTQSVAISTRKRDNVAIGYVSSDLRDHAVASFMQPLLEAHDQAHFAIHCFDTSPYAEDQVTAQLRTSGVDWHRVGQLDDAALADHIRDTGIDILVDLAGHTHGNRLGVFARKPAPVQATWLGYLNTTGLESMDYRITDAFLDPEGLTEHLHVERLVRLPHHACFAPWRASPKVVPITSARRGLVFGAVNQWPKVSPACRALWARLLAEVPDARLLVIVRGGDHPSMRNVVVDAFRAVGVDPARIDVESTRSTAAFLERLSGIDVALDTTPYGGGTTTFQCLFMGVPVVTLAGTTPMSRNSIGPLHAAGLADLVAASEDAYVSCAAALARDVSRRADLRTSLRSRIQQSDAMNSHAFAKCIEAAFMEMVR